MKVQEHVARTLCKAAVLGEVCPICEKYGEPCQIWYTFMDEADAAIRAVRNYYILTERKKPRV